MAQTSAQSASGSAARPTLALAFAALILALGLAGWRTVQVFTAAPSDPGSPFVQLAETITGPGRVRLGEGTDGNLLILIDGPAGALSGDTANRLRGLAARLYPDARPPTIQQYAFAPGTAGRPTNAELAEIAILALLAGLAGWFVLAFRPNEPGLAGYAASPRALPPANDTSSTVPLRPAPEMPALAQIDPVENAALLAEQDPRTTAAIIRNWLRGREVTS